MLGSFCLLGFRFLLLGFFFQLCFLLLGTLRLTSGRGLQLFFLLLLGLLCLLLLLGYGSFLGSFLLSSLLLYLAFLGSFRFLCRLNLCFHVTLQLYWYVRLYLVELSFTLCFL